MPLPTVDQQMHMVWHHHEIIYLELARRDIRTQHIDE